MQVAHTLVGMWFQGLMVLIPIICKIGLMRDLQLGGKSKLVELTLAAKMCHASPSTRTTR